jgi:hypothetical protein
MKRTVLALVAAGLLALAAIGAPTVAANESPCQGMFGTTGALGMPAGSWSVGEHTYTITYYYPPEGPGDPGIWTTDPVTFTVDPSAPLLPGSVFLRGSGLSATPGDPTPIGDTIHPDQATVFWAGSFLIPDWYSSVAEARAYLAENSFGFAWDGGGEVAAPQHPVSNMCAQGNLVVNGVQHVIGQIHRHYAS